MRDSAIGRTSDALARRVRKGPLLIAIDEAHILATDAGRALLNAVQRLRRKKLPLMLLLVGTPDLPRRLNSMNASFWGRSAKLRIRLLNPDAATDAIRIPFEAAGRSIAADAMEQMVLESHGYPFFLQMWGKLLWRATQADGRPASRDDVDRVRPSFIEVRNEYYIDRYEELDRVELAFVAARLSEAFIETTERTRPAVNEVIRKALEHQGRESDKHSVMTARERLCDLGYIWSVVHESRLYYEPGIPSLMRFVALNEGLDIGMEPPGPLDNGAL